jgi:hypothetical protein
MRKEERWPSSLPSQVLVEHFRIGFWLFPPHFLVFVDFLCSCRRQSALVQDDVLWDLLQSCCPLRGCLYILL